ncbi:MAG: hypothetical protein MRY79_04805 [Alphaproteobacteria bacterium]|nr:hypothetical protein [Alphaproteobacteria bacterium]
MSKKKTQKPKEESPFIRAHRNANKFATVLVGTTGGAAAAFGLAVTGIATAPAALAAGALIVGASGVIAYKI